jgi:hypothetical protein
MVVTTDGVSLQGVHVIHGWPLTERNTGLGAANTSVRLSGYARWRIGTDGLLAESKGHFDRAE